KYYNLSESIIKKISEDEDKKEAEKYKNSFYRKLNSIDEIDDFTELETEYSKLQTQITQFIHFYNNRVVKYRENIKINIKKENIKELLKKYYNLAINAISICDENEAEKYKNSFYGKLNSIDEIDDFTELETEYGKLQTQITQFIHFYNRRVDEGKEIPEEDFYDIDNIPEEYSDIPEENFIDLKQTIPEGIDISSKIPNIVFYKRINLLAEDLIILNTQVDNETKFFTPLLNKIKVGIEKIKNIHSLNENQIKSFETSINNAIKPIFEQINELATKVFGKNEYDFKIELDKEKIKLSMKINNEATTLLQQSEGFRWFFEFFFQFYFIYDLQAGDIILIDEPDAHLSIPSVKGLRNIIKKIAKEMGVTFVTTTHNPFFVDIDYFDEIRIVKKKKDGDGVEIVRFGDIDTHTEADTLKEIIDAFGLGNLNRDIITNPDNKVIFVEGITDYNYLTAFKLLYNRGKNDNEKLNLSFLPIAGLGQNKEESKNKIKILSKFKDVIQLTDEDEKANEFKEKMKVIKLTEIDENFKEIEYLFSENDKEKFKYIIKNKSFEISSLFKNIIFDL
ncbi:AAA family ATPase, partial [Brachyspira sp.]|uniref:ATP-dependent nuclease n=1 Tax=Brachyspira sp. TaxID=1977261 RepID=UPI003D7C86EB